MAIYAMVCFAYDIIRDPTWFLLPCENICSEDEDHIDIYLLVDVWAMVLLQRQLASRQRERDDADYPKRWSF